MVKFDYQIIEILYDYIPDIYDKTIDISILELEIDYREKAIEIIYQINRNSYNKRDQRE